MCISATRWIRIAWGVLCVLAAPVSATQVPLLGVQQISAGSFTTCAVVGSSVECWGANVLAEEYYLGTLYAYFYISGVPVIIPESTGVSQLTVGDEHMCALINGGVKCWGSGSYGQTGPNGTSGVTGAVPVDGATTGATSVSAGGLNT